MGKRPPSSDFQQIRETCGERIANALTREFAGLRVYIPKHLNATTRVGVKSPVVRIGFGAAARLSREFGGASVYVPRNGMGADARHSAIVQLAASGARTQSIARRVGCSERLVQLVKKDAA